MTYRTDKLEYDPMTHGIYNKKTHMPTSKETYKSFIELIKLLLRKLNYSEWQFNQMTQWLIKLQNNYDRYK